MIIYTHNHHYNYQEYYYVLLIILSTPFFVATVQPLPPTNVNVCVSFDNTPSLQIQWEVRMNQRCAFYM